MIYYFARDQYLTKWPFVYTEPSRTTIRCCSYRAGGLGSSALFLSTWSDSKRTHVPITWWPAHGQKKQQKKRRNTAKSTLSTRSWTVTRVSLCECCVVAVAVQLVFIVYTNKRRKLQWQAGQVISKSRHLLEYMTHFKFVNSYFLLCLK